MNGFRPVQTFLCLLAFGGALLMQACGGGGGSASTPAATSTPPSNTTPSSTTSLTLSYPALPTFTVGTAITAIHPTLGNATAGVTTTFQKTAGSMPPGLVLGADGSITGTPSSAGSFAFTISATNGTLSAATQVSAQVVDQGSFTLTYAAPGTLYVGVAITALAPTLTHAPSGSATTFAITQGALPQGLALKADGSIAGTPTASGDYSVTIRATNGSQTADTTLTGTVLELAVFYDFPVFVVGQPIGGLIATATHPVVLNSVPGLATTFAVTAGGLPPGLTLNAADGSLSGTPTKSGNFTATFTASNGTAQAHEARTLQVTTTDIGATASSASFVDPGVSSLRPTTSTADFYVDAVNGNDASNGTTPGTAWKTLGRLHQQVFQPGNVVHLARGSVWMNQHLLLDNDSAGSAAAPVVIQAYGSGELPTISHPRALWDNTQVFDGVFVGKGSYITILDLRVRDTDGACGFTLLAGTHHIVIAGSEVQTAGCGISVSGKDQRLLSNYIHDIGVDGLGSGIGIGFVGSNLEFGWNRMIRCRVSQSDFGFDGGAFEYYGRIVDEAGNESFDLSDNIRIHHNLISNCLDFMEAYGNMTNLVIAYNLYINSETEALEFHLDDSEHGAWVHECTYQARIENNTFVPRPDPVPGGWGVVGQLVDWNRLPDPAKSSITLRNNIFVTNYKVLSHNYLDANFIHDHNLFQILTGGMTGENWSAGATEKLGDPLFVDPSAGNFQLGAGSPAIDLGTELGYSSDLLGTAVPPGSAPDAGAFEKH